MKSKLARGFTLIELMIVVAIIGVLAMVAVPKFMSMSAKAKTSEVKANLGTIANLASAYRAENDLKGYDCADSKCGWAADGLTLYTYHFSSTVKVPATKVTEECVAKTLKPSMSKDTFIVGGSGQIDSDPACDEWQIDEKKDLKPVYDDVVQDS